MGRQAALFLSHPSWVACLSVLTPESERFELEGGGVSIFFVFSWLRFLIPMNLRAKIVTHLFFISWQNLVFMFSVSSFSEAHVNRVQNV